MAEESKTWNEQLKEWYQNSGKSQSQIYDEIHIPRGTFSNYISGSIKDLSRVSPERKRLLYQLTGLECFKDEIPTTELIKPSEDVRKSSDDLVSVLLYIDNNLACIKNELIQRLPYYESSVLLRSKYIPTSQERMQIVETAIDTLVEQMNYYKMAPPKEREELVKYLRDLGEVERWGYVVNLLSGINKPGDMPDTFARVLEAPKKIEIRKE